MGTKEKSKKREDTKKEEPKPVFPPMETGNPRSSRIWFGCRLPKEDEDGDPEDME